MLQAMQQIRQKLFLARDDAVEIPNVGRDLRVVDGRKERFFAAHEQHGALRIDIRDEQRSEEEAFAAALGFERGQKRFPFFVEMGKAQFFDLRDREFVVVFFI